MFSAAVLLGASTQVYRRVRGPSANKESELERLSRDAIDTSRCFFCLWKHMAGNGSVLCYRRGQSNSIARLAYAGSWGAFTQRHDMHPANHSLRFLAL